MWKEWNTSDWQSENAQLATRISELALTHRHRPSDNAEWDDPGECHSCWARALLFVLNQIATGVGFDGLQRLASKIKQDVGDAMEPVTAFFQNPAELARVKELYEKANKAEEEREKKKRKKEKKKRKKEKRELEAQQE